VNKLTVRTSALAGLNACLLALLGSVWISGERRIHEPGKLGAHAIASTDLTALNDAPAPPLDSDAIREQAVFHSRRSFYVVPPPLQGLSVPDYDLAGTMDLPQGKRLAFLKKRADQSSHAVHVGDDVDGWRVEHIDASRVVIAQGDQTTELHASQSAASLSGLVRGASAPPVARAESHMLGGQGQTSLVSPHTTTSPQARTFRPPPH
jgi:hypothetical protein